jgi:hypothetical protein
MLKTFDAVLMLNATGDCLHTTRANSATDKNDGAGTTGRADY